MLTDHHREARRTAIVRLLRHSPVRRQQELVRLLKREGHAVTQSSISRDLRELGVLKAGDRYLMPPEGSEPVADDFERLACVFGEHAGEQSFQAQNLSGLNFNVRSLALRAAQWLVHVNGRMWQGVTSALRAGSQ